MLMTALGGSLIAGIGSIIYFRPKLMEAKAEASIKQTEAADNKYDSLVKRLNSVEQMYAEQGKIVDSLRAEILRISEEKFASEKKIIQLASENKALGEKVDRLEKEVQAYKTLSGK